MSEPTITADEFERGYAERSGMTVEELREFGFLEIVRCGCGEEGCEGWACVTRRSSVDYMEGGIYHVRAAGEGDTRP